MDKVGVLEQIHLAVVGAWGKDVRELSVVVVPGELERSAPVVLLTWLRRPGIRQSGPIRRLIVTRGNEGAIASNLLDPIETLRPKLAITPASFASLLAPMSENCRQLSFASLKIVHVSQVALATEGGELGDSF